MISEMGFCWLVSGMVVFASASGSLGSREDVPNYESFVVYDAALCAASVHARKPLFHIRPMRGIRMLGNVGPLFTRKQAMDINVLWVVSALLIVAGLAGTVLPLLPGTLLVWAGILLGAWIDDFARVGTWTVVFITVLAMVAWALDFVAGMLGAKRAGASKLALVGAAVGTVVGLFMGLVGVLFMPLVGAAIGEFLAQQDQQRAAKVAMATWIGLMLGMVAKVVISCVMVGVFLVALWV